MVRLSRRLVQIVPERIWSQSIDSRIFAPRSKNLYRTLVILAIGVDNVPVHLDAHSPPREEP